MTHRGLVAVSLLAFLALAAPAGTSQSGEVGQTSVDFGPSEPGAPFPAGQVQEHSANLIYEWENGITEEPTEIHLEVVDEPEWMETTFEPSTVVVHNTTNSTGDLERAIITLQIDLDRDAPAYEEATATYRAIAEENGMLERAEDEGELTIEPGFRGGIDVEIPPGPNVTAWGGVVTKVPMEVTNNANGPVVVESEVVLNPADAIIEPPEPFQVNASPDDRTRTVYMEVQVPWKISITGDTVISMTPFHMPRGTQADTYEAEFFLDGRSAVPVPGPGPLFVLAGVLFVAAAQAGRRR